LIAILNTVILYWTTFYQFTQQMAIESGRLPFRETSNKLQKWPQYHIPNKPSKISKKAFATFASEDDPSTDDAPEKNPNQKKPKKGTPNKRNKRQASRPPVAASSYELPIYLACGLIHKLANCYYAFPELAPSYFRPKDELAVQIKEKLANDIDLQKQLRKLKKARRSSSSKSIKMSDTPVPNTTVK
jgi:hypothetical protein